MTARRAPLFRFEPQSEQELVCLFGAVVQWLDIPLVIEKVQTAFPDCLARRIDTGKEVRIEFELYSRNFNDHRHDASQCDLLVCWQDDVRRWPNGFVVELHDIVKAKCPWMVETIRYKPLGEPWAKDTFFTRCAENGLTDEQVDEIKAIIAFAEKENLGPEWMDTPRGTFAVGDYRRFFKVHANGQIGFSFMHLDTEDLFPELCDRLNDALEERRFSPEAKRKKKGPDGIRKQVIGEMFQNRKQLRAFLRVWRWFADARR